MTFRGTSSCELAARYERRIGDPEGSRGITACHLEVWLAGLLGAFESRILAIDARVAEVWGRLNVPDPVPTVDALLAATALVHGLTLVTRNAKDVANTGVKVLNPFSGSDTP